MKASPVRVSRRSLESWIIFVDGACEGEEEKLGTIGAVLIDPWGRVLHHLSEVGPASFMERCSDSKNPICELEIPPLCWGELLSQSLCVFYCENDAARASMIAGRAATLVASELVESFVERETGLQIKPRFARVPTSSNIADDPSRLSEHVVKSLGSTKTVVAWYRVGYVTGELPEDIHHCFVKKREARFVCCLLCHFRFSITFTSSLIYLHWRRRILYYINISRPYAGSKVPEKLPYMNVVCSWFHEKIREEQVLSPSRCWLATCRIDRLFLLSSEDSCRPRCSSKSHGRSKPYNSGKARVLRGRSSPVSMRQTLSSTGTPARRKGSTTVPTGRRQTLS